MNHEEALKRIAKAAKVSGLALSDNTKTEIRSTQTETPKEMVEFAELVTKFLRKHPDYKFVGVLSNPELGLNAKMGVGSTEEIVRLAGEVDTLRKEVLEMDEKEKEG